MKRTLTTVAALVAVQALMVGVWYVVEGRRAPEPTPHVAPMSRAAPDLTLLRGDGSALQLRETQGRPLVLHFWATWCPPCRAELPALLAYAAEGELPVLAVSLDPEWAAVARFFGADPPATVVHLPGAAAEGFDLQQLPVTFVINRAGGLRLRLDGARDWTSPSLRAVVRDAAQRR